MSFLKLALILIFSSTYSKAELLSESLMILKWRTGRGQTNFGTIRKCEFYRPGINLTSCTAGEKIPLNTAKSLVPGDYLLSYSGINYPEIITLGEGSIIEIELTSVNVKKGLIRISRDPSDLQDKQMAGLNLLINARASFVMYSCLPNYLGEVQNSAFCDALAERDTLALSKYSNDSGNSIVDFISACLPKTECEDHSIALFPGSYMIKIGDRKFEDIKVGTPSH